VFRGNTTAWVEQIICQQDAIFNVPADTFWKTPICLLTLPGCVGGLFETPFRSNLIRDVAS